jgi:uncharacterized protein (DUF433 family)
MTSELHLFLAKRSGRVGGKVTVEISRLSMYMVMNYFAEGYTIKQVKEYYPQLEFDSLRVIKKLTKDLLENGWKFNN